MESRIASEALVAGDTLVYATQRPPVPWWSSTKTVIAAATLALVRDGELELDISFEGRGFTLRQLLQRTAAVFGAYDQSDALESRAVTLVLDDQEDEANA